MSYFVFDGDINPKNVSDLIVEIESSRGKPVITNEDKDGFDVSIIKITLYINTNGGYVGTAYMLSDYFKRLIDEQFCEIDIVVSEYCHSAGIFFLYDLFQFSKGYKPRKHPIKFFLFEHTEFLIHEIGTDIHTRVEDKKLIRSIDRIKNRREKLINAFKNYLEEEEIMNLMKSEDVILDCERMAKILKAKIVKTF